MSDVEDVLALALTADGGTAGRLQSALATVGAALSLERCHLYVRRTPSDGYRLVGGWMEQGGDGRASGTASGVLPEGSGAGQSGPELELRAAVPADLEPMATEVGTLLPLTMQVPAQLDAVLLLGPRGRGLSVFARRRLERLRTPLAGVLTALHREAAFERELDAATTRLETGKRMRDAAVDPDRFMRLLLDLAVRSTSSEGGFVAVSDEAGRLTLRVAEGRPLQLSQLDVTPESGVFDWSLADTGALLLRDPERAAALAIRSILAVPLLGDRGPLGVVGLTTETRPAAFTEHNLLLLESLAEQVGLMLENERVFADFTGRYVQMLQGIAQTLDARRPETEGYHRRVARLAMALASTAGLGPDEVAAVRNAALLHDVGLAAVPGASRAFLSDIEHPTVGADLVAGMPVHPGIAGAVASHHEWYDGWGFPNGLRGEAIPLLGRVLGLSAFCAEMSTPGLARPGWASERVLEEVRTRAGTQFDPELVDAGAVALAGELSAEGAGRERS